MKVMSFNANGIRSAAKKGFFEWLVHQNVDVVCIQETKAQIEQLIPEDIYRPNGFYCEYYDAHKKGYSGVALFSRVKPLRVMKGLGFETCDTEGRYIQFDYPKVSIISLYLPSGTSGEVRQAIKYEFLDQFAPHLNQLKNEGRELILCGDYNIAHQKIDLKNWRGNQKNSGFLPEERAWMDKLFGAMGFVDSFRVLYPEKEEYTWWSQRGRARENNVGWRIDYQVITPGLQSALVGCQIFSEPMFSDHAPFVVEYQGDWCV